MNNFDKYDYTKTIKLDEIEKKNKVESNLIPTLIIIAGDLFGQMINLEEKKKVVFGRGEECDVVIENQLLSRKHCMVINEEGKIVLQDLGSTNGTYVDGKRVEKTVLKSGQRVFLGDICAFKFAYQDDIDLDLNRLIFEKAIKDRLTGIYNRTYFDELLKKEFSFHKRAKLPLSVIFIDLDDFKKINDNFGHLCGDEILKKTAKLIQSKVREADYFCRFGGEEFVLLLKNTEYEKAVKKAESLRQALEQAEFLCSGNIRLKVTASLGVATLENDNFSTHKRLLAEADNAMYKAKESGKNAVKGYRG